MSAEYYSLALDIGDKLVSYRRKRNICCERLVEILLDMYDSYAATDIDSLHLATLAYKKSKENRAYISGFDANCAHCRRISAVGKIYCNNGDHENALIYYAEELKEKVNTLIKHYNDLFEDFDGGDRMAVLKEMTDVQIKSLSSELFDLPASGRSISDLAKKSGRYDLAVSALEKGHAFSRKAYKLCRFLNQQKLMRVPPQYAVEFFGEGLADAYRSTGDINSMFYVMEDMYHFTKVAMDPSDDEIASAANDIAWEYFECGRSERAEQYIAEALKCASKTANDYHCYLDSAAYIYADIGKHDIAMCYAEELMTLYLERQKKHPEIGTNELRIAEAKVTMAYCHAKAGNKDKAEEILNEALVVLEKLSGLPVSDDDTLQRARKLKQELADMVVSSAQQPHSYVLPKTVHDKPNVKKYTEYDYGSLGDEEVDRLCIQPRITERMDLPVLQRIFSKYKAPVVIDFGCNQGDLGMARFSELEYDLYLGIDHSAVAIETAEKKYGNNRNKYYCADSCDEFFVENVRAQLRNNGADGVDIIFVSMMMLHCKEQEATLKKLLELLRDGGTIFIRDIDDRDNFAFPDPDGIFEKAFELVKYNTMGGDRHCGRKIGSLLRRAGYKNVTQESCGLSTVGMNNDDRMALYHTYFDFQIPDAYSCLAAAPNDAATLQRFGWWVYNIPQIEAAFRRNEVEFTLGLIVYTAEK